MHTITESVSTPHAEGSAKTAVGPEQASNGSRASPLGGEQGNGNRALRDQPASCRAALVSAGTYSISSLCSGRWASALTASV